MKRTKGGGAVFGHLFVVTILCIAASLLTAFNPVRAELDLTAIEAELSRSEFQLEGLAGVRWAEDRNQRGWFVSSNGARINVKVVRIPPGRESFNNMPRYELIAYQLQKLFLEPDEYVVPPVTIRGLPVAEVRKWDADAVETIKDSGIVLLMIQAWLPGLKPMQPELNRERLEAEPAFAAAWAKFNTLTFLARHSDSNVGNVLISEDGAPPRIWAVDNDVAFSSEESEQGRFWRPLRVHKFPPELIDRLTALDESDLKAALAVVAEYRMADGKLEPVKAGKNIEPRLGVRVNGRWLQYGLKTGELRYLGQRLKKLQADIKRGKITALETPSQPVERLAAPAAAAAG